MRLNVGLHFFLLTRKNNIVAFIIRLVIYFATPIIISFATQAQIQQRVDPFSSKLGTCPREPCYHYVMGSDNSSLPQVFADSFKAQFGVANVSYEVVGTLSELEETISRAKGHYMYGIYIDTVRAPTITAHIFTRNKMVQQPMYDAQVAKSPDLALQRLISGLFAAEDFDVRFSVLNCDIDEILQRMKANQIVLFSLVYFNMGISIVVVLAMTLDKRIYEYFIVCGLDIPRFVLGVFLYTLIEMVAASLVVGIIFTSMKMLSQDALVNMVVPLFNIIPSIHYVFAFGYFSFAVCQQSGSVVALFIIVGYLPSFTMIMSFVNTSAGMFQNIKILKGVMQFFLPGMSCTAVLETVTAALQVSDGELGKLLTYSSNFHYSVLTANLIALFSTVFYVCVGYLIDNYCGFQNHPIRRFTTGQQDGPGDIAPHVLLSLQGLSVHFNTNKCHGRQNIVKALDNVSLHFKKSGHRNIIGIVAQNGGGKTTLFKTILGSNRPTAGSILLAGSPKVRMCSKDYFRRMAVVFQENIVLSSFTVRDQMSLMANIMGEDSTEILNILAQMGIEKTVRQKVTQLSMGQQRRLNIATSILRKNPVVRILDEPACGVDIESRKWLWQYLKRKNDDMVLLTTHIMEEAEELCDEVVILKEGRLVCHGSLLYTKQTFGKGYNIIFSTECITTAEFEKFLSQIGLRQGYDIAAKDGYITNCYVGYQHCHEIGQILKSYPMVTMSCPNLTEIFIKISEDWDGVSKVEEQQQ